MTKYQIHAKTIAGKLLPLIEAAIENSDQWQLPWHTRPDLFTQTNAATGSAYTGGNVFALAMTVHDQDYESNQWATYKQWQNLGAQVRRGEKSTTLVRYVVKETQDEDGEIEQTVYPVVFNVFNREQVDGYNDDSPRGDGAGSIEDIDQFIANTDAVVRTGTMAYYRPTADDITMPAKEQFDSSEQYYATMLHELTHWTGHGSRLDRPQHPYKTHPREYGFEELVAELGSATLAARFGIKPDARADHHLYLSHWVKQIKEDPSVIIKAASAAQKAVDHLDSLQPAEQTKDLVAA